MFVIDESSYRIDKTSFPTEEEAKQYAGEAARTLNRAINVYELLEGELHFALRVLPDGSTEEENPLDDPASGDQITEEAPVLGEIVAELDAISEELEKKGAITVAGRIDNVCRRITAEQTRTHEGLKQLAASLKEATARKTYDIKAKLPGGKWKDANSGPIKGAKEYAVFNPDGVPFLKGLKDWNTAHEKASRMRRGGAGLPFA